MSCPDDYLKGLIFIRGGVNINDTKEITINSPPFVANFQPRNVPLTLIQNNIEESFDNTIIYKGNTYNIANPVQLCMPVHRGYSFDNPQDPKLELIVPFQFSGYNPGSYPSGLFLCFPIYENSIQNKAQYIEQFLNPDIGIQSLRSLFQTDTTNSNNSVSYQSCFEYIDQGTNNISGNTTFIAFVFSNGINMTPKNIQTLSKQILVQNQIPPFSIPASLRNYSPTVLRFSFDNSGNKAVNSTSTLGFTYTHSISSGTSDFLNRFQYFTYPPKRKWVQKSGNDTCSTTTQYKCVPMELLKNNLSERDISNGHTISNIYQQQTERQNQLIEGSDNSSSSTSDTAVDIVIGVTGGLLIIGIALYFVNSITAKLSK